jgi:hypothetical protein
MGSYAYQFRRLFSTPTFPLPHMRRHMDFISQNDKKISSSVERLAVDGMGYTYVVNQSGAQVNKLDPEDKLSTASEAKAMHQAN